MHEIWQILRFNCQLLKHSWSISQTVGHNLIFGESRNTTKNLQGLVVTGFLHFLIWKVFLWSSASPNFHLRVSWTFNNCAEEEIYNFFHLTDHNLKFPPLHNCWGSRRPEDESLETPALAHVLTDKCVFISENMLWRQVFWMNPEVLSVPYHWVAWKSLRSTAFVSFSICMLNIGKQMKS